MKSSPRNLKKRTLISNPNHAGNTVETFYLEQPEFSDNQNITGFHMCRTCRVLQCLYFGVKLIVSVSLFPLTPIRLSLDRCMLFKLL